jgi:hypothetical protein
MTFAFWQSTSWTDYLTAYGREHESHDGGVIVPLGHPEAMWRNLRKGHKSDVKKGEREFTFTIHDDPSEDDALRLYQELHEADAGRKTRPQETFDLMRSWLGTHGLLLLAWWPIPGSAGRNLCVGAAYFLTHGSGAYYASAARLPGQAGPIGHFLVWSAMRHLAELGYEYLDMGPSPEAIAHFKRGFCAS